MASSYVYLIQVTDSAIPRSDSDVFELDVHIIFSCNTIDQRLSAPRPKTQEMAAVAKGERGSMEEDEGIHSVCSATFNELSSVDLTGRDLERDNMVLQRKAISYESGPSVYIEYQVPVLHSEV